MIELQGGSDDPCVLVGGRCVEIVDVDENGKVYAECDLEDLSSEMVKDFPPSLSLRVSSDDGFGTCFFHELELSQSPEGFALSFLCHTPNKFWEGQFGLAAYLSAIQAQVVHHENWAVSHIELEDDWKALTLERILAAGDPLEASIQAAASDLKVIMHGAEVALSGLPWKKEFLTNEDSFCRELLYPLLRRMGFLFVRYAHGKKEYGKDFTFSEATTFGHHRHYGLQAKAGDVSGAVNSAIDELLGQIKDAFSMPFYELGSKDKRYISTFVIAISGKFKENAREKIVEKMPSGVIGSVYFLDRERITELVERFWKR